MMEFRMRHIRVDQFAILADSVPANVGIETNIQIGADSSRRIVSIRLKNNYVNGKEILLTSVVSCFFQISPESWVSNQSDGKTIISKHDLAHLAMHTFGTARGILFCKTEGTPFQSVILPPTNVESMIAQDLVIE